MTGPEETDSLIARIAMADRVAFETVFHQASGTFLAIAQRITGDLVEAEEILEQLYVDLWDQADHFRDGPLPAIDELALTIRDRAITRKRSRANRPPELRTSDLLSQPGHHTVDEAATLAGCLETLPKARATLMRRIILDGESYDDLAQAADVDVETVRASVQGAIVALRACMISGSDFSVEDTISAAEAALGVGGHEENGQPADISDVLAFWQSQIAHLMLSETDPIPVPEQVLRRITSRVVPPDQETIWAQIWPYAVAGALAAGVLWLAMRAGILLPL
ncbi:hypothetical protein [Marivita hallyeonensis]|uniref:DNA-directed RNA polymerase specialized sigma subunit, sigma24 family n=1 Tax=Marivita hallyeonensis TaxID=996342 RepID=A0A1M5WA21_9RHOB|nr:hypothetical protein [Marivita hallyeonensis]SHH84044.1 DNA-directed RNA polymerase specialized sigma subunit, sigma24 family [Marivita hallyeonensis]